MEKLSIDVGSPSPAIAAPGRRPIPPLCCFECQRQDLRGNFALETLSIVARQVLTLTLNAMKHDKASISVFSLPLYAMVWTQPNRTRTRKNAVHFVCTPRTTCDTSKLVSSPLGGALIVRIIYSGIHSWEKNKRRLFTGFTHFNGLHMNSRARLLPFSHISVSVWSSILLQLHGRLMSGRAALWGLLIGSTPENLVANRRNEKVTRNHLVGLNWCTLRSDFSISLWWRWGRWRIKPND